MSQLSKVAKHLRRNNTGPGITAAALAKKAGVPKATVYKRIHDLRVNEGHTIYTNTRIVRGVKRNYYRMAS